MYNFVCIETTNAAGGPESNRIGMSKNGLEWISDGNQYNQAETC